MNRQTNSDVRVETDIPKWPKFHYDEARGAIRLTGQYRSPRFFIAWEGICAIAALFGWMPFIALVATLYPTREKLLAACEAAPGLKVVPCGRSIPYDIGEFTRQDFFVWLGIWLVLVLVSYVWCQFRLFRSKLNIELTADHLRIGRKHYALDRIRSIDWDIHEEANNPERGMRERNFYARCYQVVMLYGARPVEIAAFRKDKKKAEALTLMLATAFEMARSGARAAAAAASRPAPEPTHGGTSPRRAATLGPGKRVMDWLTQYGTYLDQGGPAAFVEFLGGFFTMLVVMRFLPEALKGIDALSEEDGFPRLLRGAATITLGIPIIYGGAIAAGSLVR